MASMPAGHLPFEAKSKQNLVARNICREWSVQGQVSTEANIPQATFAKMGRAVQNNTGTMDLTLVG
ncbi:hypothetical protein SAMN05660862_3190 [Sphingobacterium psychroaquaticum]|uniref:Uncharacterized protein n=1 Tax=Sphingobacterium psychroaquaticum TaxID=561061 RepID=A0A1X7KSP2_9SPHI|nr:hypothetical protein SAMN05660862_3190 [Sphingobacterium psychroaquaticum]